MSTVHCSGFVLFIIDTLTTIKCEILCNMLCVLSMHEENNACSVFV